MNGRTAPILVFALFLLAGGASATGPATQPASNDWPQFRGPNRDSVAPNSPKLLDVWPTNGPPLVWKSDWIPGFYGGGCSSPVVADGKVFVYSTAKTPVEGGHLYKIITAQALENAGWRTDLPADLVKKIEEARTVKGRPIEKFWPWYEIKDPKEKAKDVEALLVKKPDLDKYINDFLATLTPEQASKYGEYIKRRLCMPGEFGYPGSVDGFSWNMLEQLSKLQDIQYASLRECGAQLEKIIKWSALGFHLDNNSFLKSAWEHCFTRSDRMVCLDATTGKTLWSKDFPLDGETLLNLNKSGFMDVGPVLGIGGSPAFWDGKCYFTGAAALYCLSANDGAVLWQIKSKPEQCSVLVFNGILYYCGTAYNAQTGEVLWKTPLWKTVSRHDWHDAGRCTSPGLWTSGGKTYILGNDGGDWSNLIFGLDVETGKDLWSLKYSNTLTWLANYAVCGDLLASEGKTYKMTPTGLQRVGSYVQFTKGMAFGADRVIYQDHLYQNVGASEGSKSALEGYCCFDLKTGELNWIDKDVPEGWYAPSILADGKIFKVINTRDPRRYTDLNYPIVMIKPTPEKYVQLGSFDPGLIPFTSLALAGGKLFVRTETGISCYDLRTEN